MDAFQAGQQLGTLLFGQLQQFVREARLEV